MCSKTDDVGWRDVVRQYGTIWEYNASFSNNAANHLHLLDKHAKLDTKLTVCFALYLVAAILSFMDNLLQLFLTSCII